MSRLIARIRGAVLLAGLTAVGIWYLMDNPAAARAFAGVVAAALSIALVVRARRISSSRRRLQTLGDLLTLTPGEFEEAVGGALAGSSYRRVKVVGGAGDLGVDIVCMDGDGLSVVVQCKRHAPGVTVGSADVQRLLGSMTHCGADRGILVTTSRFSAPARALAQANGIDLMDGVALVETIRRAGRGRQPVLLQVLRGL